MNALNQVNRLFLVVFQGFYGLPGQGGDVRECVGLQSSPRSRGRDHKQKPAGVLLLQKERNYNPNFDMQILFATLRYEIITAIINPFPGCK